MDYIDHEYYGNALIEAVNNSISPIDEMFKYGIQIGSEIDFFKDNSLIDRDLNSSVVDYYSAEYSAVYGDDNFYQTDKFTEFFSIIEGSYPNQTNQLLIDYAFAKNYNYSVGSTINLEFYLYRNYMIGYQDQPTQNLYEIAGIYTSKYTQIQIGYVEYEFDYVYNPAENNITLMHNHMEQFGQNAIVQYVPLFGYMNFYTYSTHPLIIDIYYLLNDYEVFPFFRTVLAVNLDLTQIEFNQIERYILDLNQNVEYFLPRVGNFVTFYSYIIQNLEETFNTFRTIRIVVPLLNLPLLIFAVVLGSIAIKNETYQRMEEFLILRTKGFSNRAITQQIILEGFIQAFLAAILGNIIGIPIFLAVSKFMNQVFRVYNITALSFVFNWNVIIVTFITSIIAVIIASAASLIMIIKLPANKLIENITQNTPDGNIDEQLIFPPQTDYEDFDPDEIGLKKKNNHVEEEKLTKKQIRAKKKEKWRKQRKTAKIYKKPTQHLIQKRKKISVILILIGIFPLILIILARWGQLDNAPDLLFNFYNNNTVIIQLLPIFVLLTPAFLTFGIIRFIGVEYSHILARITSKITKPLLGNLNRLLGLELIRRKQYTNLTSIIGVFISLIFFINIFLSSFLNIPMVEANLESGVDANIQYSKSVFDYDSNINQENISKLENELLNIQIGEEKNIVKDSLTLYLEVPINQIPEMEDDPLAFIDAQQFTEGDTFSHFTIYTNITKLNEFLLEDGKEDYARSMDEMKKFNDQISFNNTPNCIVSERYLKTESKTIGDIIEIPHYYYNETRDLIAAPYNASIIESSDYLPGLWLKSIGSSLEESFDIIPFQLSIRRALLILMDISTLENLNFDLNNFTIASMVNFNNDIKLTNSLVNEIKNEIQDISSTFNWVSTTLFYYDNFEELINVKQSASPIFLVNYGYIIEFGVIGIIVALSVSMLLNSFQQNNHFFNQILISRGFGRKGLLKFNLGIIFSMFLVGFVVGGVIGITSSVLLFKSKFFTQIFIPFNAYIPISANSLYMSLIIGIIPMMMILFQIWTYFMKPDEFSSQGAHKANIF